MILLYINTYKLIHTYTSFVPRPGSQVWERGYTHLFFLSDVLSERGNGVEPSALLPRPKVDLELWAVEVPHGAHAQVRGEPRGVQVECWCGVLYHVAVIKSREPLAAGDMLWVVVLVIG